MSSVSSCILLDVSGGIYESTKHLISNGHTCIAYTGGPIRSVISKEKFKGYCKAMELSGLCIHPELIYHKDFSLETGYQAAKTFLSSELQPTAIVAENDILAIGCIKYCLKKSLLYHCKWQ